MFFLRFSRSDSMCVHGLLLYDLMRSMKIYSRMRSSWKVAGRDWEGFFCRAAVTEPRQNVHFALTFWPFWKKKSEVLLLIQPPLSGKSVHQRFKRCSVLNIAWENEMNKWGLCGDQKGKKKRLLSSVVAVYLTRVKSQSPSTTLFRGYKKINVARQAMLFRNNLDLLYLTYPSGKKLKECVWKVDAKLGMWLFDKSNIFKQNNWIC